MCRVSATSHVSHPYERIDVKLVGLITTVSIQLVVMVAKIFNRTFITKDFRFFLHTHKPYPWLTSIILISNIHLFPFLSFVYTLKYPNSEKAHPKNNKCTKVRIKKRYVSVCRDIFNVYFFHCYVISVTHINCYFFHIDHHYQTTHKMNDVSKHGCYHHSTLFHSICCFKYMLIHKF